MMNTIELIRLAESWANDADSSLRFFSTTSEVATLATDHRPEECRALLRCAIQMRESLRSSPDFRQSLQSLGLEPIAAIHCDSQPTMAEQSLYDYVMTCLREKDIPQRRIATESGVPFSTVCKVAQGSVKHPSVHTIQRLYDYFKKAA